MHYHSAKHNLAIKSIFVAHSARLLYSMHMHIMFIYCLLPTVIEYELWY